MEKKVKPTINIPWANHSGTSGSSIQIFSSSWVSSDIQLTIQSLNSRSSIETPITYIFSR